jgi:hypothetical protein
MEDEIKNTDLNDNKPKHSKKIEKLENFFNFDCACKHNSSEEFLNKSNLVLCPKRCLNSFRYLLNYLSSSDHNKFSQFDNKKSAKLISLKNDPQFIISSQSPTKSTLKNKSFISKPWKA